MGKRFKKSRQPAGAKSSIGKEGTLNSRDLATEQVWAQRGGKKLGKRKSARTRGTGRRSKLQRKHEQGQRTPGKTQGRRRKFWVLSRGKEDIHRRVTGLAFVYTQLWGEDLKALGEKGRVPQQGGGSSMGETSRVFLNS